MICERILLIRFLNESKIILLRIVKLLHSRNTYTTIHIYMWKHNQQ